MFVELGLQSTSQGAVRGALVATPFAETEFIGEREVAKETGLNWRASLAVGGKKKQQDVSN